MWSVGGRIKPTIDKGVPNSFLCSWKQEWITTWFDINCSGNSKGVLMGVNWMNEKECRSHIGRKIPVFERQRLLGISVVLQDQLFSPVNGWEMLVLDWAVEKEQWIWNSDSVPWWCHDPWYHPTQLWWSVGPIWHFLVIWIKVVKRNRMLGWNNGLRVSCMEAKAGRFIHFE